MAKDQSQSTLAGAAFAVGGALPRRFWHKTNIRKDPPNPLPVQVKKSDKGTCSDQRNFQFPQEYLWRPDYRVWVSLPIPYQQEFVQRLKDRRWHFCPCLGLSELFADLEYCAEFQASLLAAGSYPVVTVVRQDLGQVDLASACAQKLALQSFRMPAEVTTDRVFTHRAYWAEFSGRAFTVTTNQAWRCGDENVVFL